MSLPFLNLAKNRFTSCISVYALVLTSTVIFLLTGPAVAQQKIDEEYTAMIKEFTIEPFTTKWVNYLPYSDKVPTPLDILGHIAGAADVLSYTHEIYEYMREVAKASDRVEVFNIGYTEEGREMILVVVSDEDHIKNLEKYKEITAKLADPRTITEAEAEELIEEGLPFYRLTGGLHSGETGSPEMLMELVYRLAVDESEFIREIRENSIVMITPVIEPDGRDKMVDVRMAPRKDPNAPQQSFLYWGAYVGHDNNRDGMSLTLKLYQNLVRTYLEYHPQVVHDLHESASHFYTSTGTGPYNPWFDPIVINEWQTLAYQEITELTKQGIPGVWTHGFYDGWTPNYTFMIGNLHNAIGRFYEIQGAGDASTRRINTNPQRAWFRPNPPLASTMWSMRSNNNLSQSGVLVAINYVANNKETFLENFYIKSKRSVAKATTEGPAAYVLPADDPRPEQQARLLKLFQMQGAEVHKANSSFTVDGQTFGAGSYVLRLDQPYSRIIDMFLDKQYYNPNDPRPYDDIGWTLGPLYDTKTVRIEDAGILSVPMTKVEDEIIPEGGVRVLTGGEDEVRFGWRFSRSSNFIGSLTTSDGRPYDVVAKQTNTLAASNAYLINYKANSKLTTFRFKNTSLKIHAAEESFTVAGQEFKPGTFILRSSENPGDLERQLDEAGKALGFIAWGVSDVPDISTHEIEVPRIAVVHGWQSRSLQPEGWMRIALDEFEIPYDYVPIQDLRTNTNLRGSYDVIMVGYIGLNAMLYGVGGDNPRPYMKTDLTPNLGRQASTDDIRGGIEMEGVINLKNFVESGGLFITITSSTELPIHFFFAQGLSRKETPGLWARGGVYRTTLMDKNSPIAYGFDDELGVYFNGSPVFNGGSRPVGGTVETTARPSGRGDLNDDDIFQGRPKDLGQPPPGSERGGRGGFGGRGGRGQQPPIIQEPEQQFGGRGGRGGGRGRGGRSRAPQYKIIFQYTPNTQELLISGGIRAGEQMAGTPALVDAKMGDGHTLMFSFNPFRRSQTQGSYTLIFNAFLHYNDLDPGK